MSADEVVLGFDFGTTNSLASVVVGGELITFLDNEQPIPSVVSFEGGKVEVGRKAHDKLTSAGLGVQGSTVRSPKSLLGKDELIIDGVRRDPVQMVEHVLHHVREFVLQTKTGRGLKMERVVATIPVNMEGRRRGLLRQAFRQAGMSVVQFVHEPLAALYGYLRSSENTEDLSKRYEAYGWHTQVVDWKKTGNYVEDVEELFNAIQKAKAVTDKPSLITLRTIIGWPSPKKQGTGKIHGSALGAEEIVGLKQALGFDPEQTFQVDADVIAHTRGYQAKADKARQAWEASFDAWASENADKKELLDRIQSGQVPAGLEAALPKFEAGTSVSTRVASGKVINAIAGVMPELWGGSADLADSNMTTISGAKSFVPAEWSTHEWTGDQYGRVLHFGIREHAMGSILNGIALHGNTRAFGGTFLIFSDYMRPAVRLAALMGVPSIFVWTHDSIALGEDGPTHQPIEQLATLRAIPNLDIVRPADGNETAYAWKTVLERRQGPSGLALSRQNLAVYPRGEADETGAVYAGAENTAKGAYVLLEAANQKPEVILIATGSEVEIAVAARLQLEAQGIATRVVSAPCLEWFDEQSAEYREQVLPASVKAKVSVEAGLSLGWNKYVGANGRSVSIEHFGASADAKTLYREFGMTAEAVVAAAQESIAAL